MKYVVYTMRYGREVALVAGPRKQCVRIAKELLAAGRPAQVKPLHARRVRG